MTLLLSTLFAPGCSKEPKTKAHFLVLVVDQSADRYCGCNLPVDEIEGLSNNYQLPLYWMGDFVGLGAGEKKLNVVAPNGWAVALVKGNELLYLGQNGTDLSEIYISSL